LRLLLIDVQDAILLLLLLFLLLVVGWGLELPRRIVV